MRNATFLGIVLFVLTVESSLLADLPLQASLSALFVLFLVLERSVLQGALLALAVGYLADILLGTSRGFLGAVYVLSFFLLRLPASRLSGGGPLFVTLGGVGVAITSTFVAFGVEHFVGPGHSRFGQMLAGLPSQLVLSFVFAYPVFALCSRVDARFLSREDDFAFRG